MEVEAGMTFDEIEKALDDKNTELELRRARKVKREAVVMTTCSHCSAQWDQKIESHWDHMGQCPLYNKDVKLPRSVLNSGPVTHDGLWLCHTEGCSTYVDALTYRNRHNLQTNPTYLWCDTCQPGPAPLVHSDSVNDHPDGASKTIGWTEERIRCVIMMALGEASAEFMSKSQPGTEQEMPTGKLIAIANRVALEIDCITRGV